MANTSPLVAQEITTGVFRIPLPLPLPDLTQINSYALVDDDSLILIDPGWREDTSETILVDALAQLDRTPSDVTGMLITHSHWDHYTRALDWQQRHGIPVYLGHEERHTIDAFDLGDGAHPQQVRLLRLAGARDLADTIDHLELDDHEKNLLFGPPNHWVHHGQVLTCASQKIEVHATPGHTRGHVVYDLPDTGVTFTGDHLLPRITPSIGFERTPEPSPLTSYLDSLRASTAAPSRRMLPAHGALTALTDVRAKELLAHHDERLTAIHAAVAAGAVTAAEIAEGMVWTRRNRALAELSPLHAMTAILEVRAHLVHLALQGRLTMTTGAVETFATA